MSNDPILFQANACPVCGGDVMSYESMEGGDFSEGEHAFCADNCGWFGSVGVVEDGGDAFPSTASDIEPIVDLLNESKEHVQKLAAALRELKALCETLMDEDGDVATGPLITESYVPIFNRVEEALMATPAPRIASNPEVSGPPSGGSTAPRC